MANIVIGYQNKCLDSGVTFTPSSEATGYDADNLGIAHPSEYWRIDTITSGQNVVLTFPKPEVFNLVAPLYTTSAPHWNALPATSDFREYSAGTVDEGWTYTNIDTVSPFAVISGIPVFAVTSDTTSGEHQIRRKITRDADQESWKFSLYVAAYGIGFDEKIRMRVQASTSGDFALAIIDPASGAIDSTADGGDVTLNNSTIAQVANPSVATGGPAVTFYRVTLDFTAVNGTSLTFYINLVNSAGDVGHAEAITLYFGGAMVRQRGGASVGGSVEGTGGEAKTWVASNAEGAGMWGFDETDTLSSDPSTFWPLCANVDSQTFFDARGWTHATYQFDANGWQTNASNQMKVFFYDMQNSTSFNGGSADLDISNIYVGPAWQPTRNVADGWVIRPAAGSPPLGRAYGGQEYRPTIPEPRELTLRLAYETPADAFADAVNMGLKVGQHSPVLVIIDPVESTYAQEQMVYGTLTDLQVGHMGWFSDRGDGTAGSRYEISMTVRELLP